MKYAKSRYDQNLVADQPGRMIFFIGFFIALILGLAFRGVTSPQRVQTLVAEAAGKIHKNIEAHFESAEVSLSNNGFPRLAVVIHNVEMTSNLTCWGQPRLVAKEIILPFSFLAMLFEKQPFKKILATDVELRLRSAYSPCNVTIETPSPPITSKAAITLVNRRKDMDLAVNPTIDRVEIDQLRVQYDLFPQNAMEVVDFSLQVKSQQPKVISLEAKTHLIKESFLQNFASHGKVLMEYKEFPEQELKTQFYGHWREGSYSLKADYKFSDTSLMTETELKHIPATQVISALKNYGWLREDWDGRNIWVTMNGHSEGKLKEWEKTPVFLSDVLVEGDLGEIEVEEFRALQLKPFAFKPLQARIKNLKTAQFLDFMKQPRSLGFLGELGEFNGRLELINDQEMRLIGKQTGLEFMFSNKGQRQVQKLTSLEGEIKLRQNKWELATNSIVLDQGQFDGDFRLSADRDLKKINLQWNAENLMLSAPVEKLMTGLVQKAVFKSQLQMRWNEGQLEQLTGSLKAPALAVESLQFEKLNSQFNLKNEVLSLQMTAQSFQVQPHSKTYDLLKKVIGVSKDSTAEEPSEKSFTLKQLSGRFEMSLNHQLNHELNWKNLTAQWDDKGDRLFSDGGWDASGALTGKIQVGGKAAASKWSLMGHRDQPQVQLTP